MLTYSAPTVPDFEAAFSTILLKAMRDGAVSVDVKSGDLHRIVGGYPGADHRMPVCCAVMRSETNASDKVLAQPPKGNGATLVIRYHLPR